MPVGGGAHLTRTPHSSPMSLIVEQGAAALPPPLSLSHTHIQYTLTHAHAPRPAGAVNREVARARALLPPPDHPPSVRWGGGQRHPPSASPCPDRPRRPGAGCWVVVSLHLARRGRTGAPTACWGSRRPARRRDDAPRRGVAQNGGGGAPRVDRVDEPAPAAGPQKRGPGSTNPESILHSNHTALV